MLEVDLQNNSAQEASIAYGSNSLIDNSPGYRPNTGDWEPNIRLSQELQTKYNYKFWTTPAVNQEDSETLVSNWPEKEDPFTQPDLLSSEEVQVQELIFRVKTSSSLPYRESLANRLFTLFNDAKEDDPASLGIAVGSFRNFYSFLHLHTNLKCPTISLTPDYNIYASWRGKQNRVFSVHFLPNADTRFVIFKPNDRHPERQIRISGSATTDILMETVSPYGALDWISE